MRGTHPRHPREGGNQVAFGPFVEIPVERKGFNHEKAHGRFGLPVRQRRPNVIASRARNIRIVSPGAGLEQTRIGRNQEKEFRRELKCDSLLGPQGVGAAIA